mmetsp:Transcript_12816/g.21234  ORF Transcript_12816/g.21234 Transcript_12816/m.21234 type:complete len:269 (-) Transcript_12816:682-1488(-)
MDTGAFRVFDVFLERMHEHREFGTKAHRSPILELKLCKNALRRFAANVKDIFDAKDIDAHQIYFKFLFFFLFLFLFFLFLFGFFCLGLLLFGFVYFHRLGFLFFFLILLVFVALHRHIITFLFLFCLFSFFLFLLFCFLLRSCRLRRCRLRFILLEFLLSCRPQCFPHLFSFFSICLSCSFRSYRRFVVILPCFHNGQKFRPLALLFCEPLPRNELLDTSSDFLVLSPFSKMFGCLCSRLPLILHVIKSFRLLWQGELREVPVQVRCS